MADNGPEEGDWEYRALPGPVLLPACQHCRNRLNVHALAQAVYWCGDCSRPFSAVWRKRPPGPTRAETGG